MTSRRAPDFASIAELDAASLRALLAADDPQVRLHAAWALGIRASDGGVSAARGLIARELVPGVRRHLAVMLGGDVEALRALLELDPSERVRETALRLAVQSWPHDDRPGLAACVSAVLDDSSDDVRLAALELVHDLGLSVGVDRLARHLHASDGRTREASIRALLAPGAANEGVTASDGARCVFDASFSWSDARRRATWERLASGHRDALIASARAHALDTSGWVELVQYAFDDGVEDFGVMAWLLAHGAPLEEEVLRVSRPASIPQSFSIGVASRFVDDPRGYAPWRALRLLADRGHEGARIEPELEGALREIRGAIRDTPLLDEEASDQYRLDLEWIVVGLARLAGEPAMISTRE